MGRRAPRRPAPRRWEPWEGSIDRWKNPTGLAEGDDRPVPSPVQPAPGRVRSLHRKPEMAGEHGLPKPTVDEVTVDARGVGHDFNRYRHEDLHDAADQAVLLMPVEMIRTLNAEGWPIQEGDIGENI